MEDVYTQPTDKAMLQLGTMIAGGVSDIGKMVAGNRLNKIAQTFGVFNAIDRLNDTNYGAARSTITKTRLLINGDDKLSVSYARYAFKINGDAYYRWSGLHLGKIQKFRNG